MNAARALIFAIDLRHPKINCPDVAAIVEPAAAKATSYLGKGRPILYPAGAEAFRRDIVAARIVLLDTGHFALETEGGTIADEIRRFFLE